MFARINRQQIPYGAFELKASYQRNMLLGQLVLCSLITLALTAPILYRALFGETLVVIPLPAKGDIIEQRITIGPPPSIERPRERPQPTPPPQQQEMTNQIVVIDDSAWDDSQPVELLSSRSDWSDLNEQRDSGGTGNGIDTTALLADDYFPAIDEYVFTETPPSMIHYVTPDYPNIARAAEITGKVVVKALVDKDGSVVDARIYVSSGSSILDEAALKAAYKNSFSPGIQNGLPVRCWVAYSVDFKISR